MTRPDNTSHSCCKPEPADHDFRAPGGDESKTNILLRPHLAGREDLTPVTLTFKDVNGRTANAGHDS